LDYGKWEIKAEFQTARGIYFTANPRHIGLLPDHPIAVAVRGYSDTAEHLVILQEPSKASLDALEAAMLFTANLDTANPIAYPPIPSFDLEIRTALAALIESAVGTAMKAGDNEYASDLWKAAQSLEYATWTLLIQVVPLELTPAARPLNQLKMELMDIASGRKDGAMLRARSCFRKAGNASEVQMNRGEVDTRKLTPFRRLIQVQADACKQIDNADHGAWLRACSLALEAIVVYLRGCGFAIAALAPMVRLVTAIQNEISGKPSELFNDQLWDYRQGSGVQSNYSLRMSEHYYISLLVKARDLFQSNRKQLGLKKSWFQYELYMAGLREKHGVITPEVLKKYSDNLRHLDPHKGARGTAVLQTELGLMGTSNYLTTLAAAA
jgi:hypothetical protein